MTGRLPQGARVGMITRKLLSAFNPSEPPLLVAEHASTRRDVAPDLVLNG